jgi:hypothetical protein
LGQAGFVECCDTVRKSDTQSATDENHCPNHEEDVMQSKIIALASVVGLAGAVTIVASTGAKALRLPDDVYYYSSVTRAFGHTPRRDRFVYRWAWAYDGPVSYCARRLRSYDPSTGTYLDRRGVRRLCP